MQAATDTVTFAEGGMKVDGSIYSGLEPTRSAGRRRTQVKPCKQTLTLGKTEAKEPNG
ncbi:MAG: hypothetical protein ACK4UN_17465 [Limisphaerales bacterium]